jgi:hypothetical protein
MLKWKILLLALSYGFGVAHAGYVTGTVTNLVVRAYDGMIYVVVTGTPVGKPACATHNYWMIMNENSTSGKQQLAVLMTAKALGQTVTIWGNGTCTRYTDGEDIAAVEVT